MLLVRRDAYKLPVLLLQLLHARLQWCCQKQVCLRRSTLLLLIANLVIREKYRNLVKRFVSGSCQERDRFGVCRITVVSANIYKISA